MDDDLEGLSREALAAEVRRLRAGIRAHRDSSGHELCWHHPALWALLPEKSDPLPVVPEWPQFMQGCIRYRQSLDEQAPAAPRSAAPYTAETLTPDPAPVPSRDGRVTSRPSPDDARTDVHALYAERLTTPQAAAALIPPGAKVAMSLGVGQPPALLRALAERAAANEVGDLDLYYLLSTAIAGDTVLRYELGDRLRPHSLFHGAIERKLEARGAAEGRKAVWFIPTGFQQVPHVLCHHVGVDTLLATVSPMDADGFFSFGTNTDYALALSRTARRVLLEVNPHMPRVYGDCTVHVSKVTALVEHAAPLLEVPRAAPQPEDLAIGALVAGLVEHGATLQMGIGALPDAVCAALRGHRDLGVHTEMLTPGLVALMREGVITNAAKTLHPGKAVFTFSMGDRTTYDFLHENQALEARPVDYVNDPAVIARNAKMVSVNATLQVDLFGACCSEYLNGRQYTAAGGQLDFVRGAAASEGGKSVIACHATAAKGTVSRIVARLDGPVTTPRNKVQYLVTEHGCVQLRGLTTDQRARALIGLAAPAFREGLERDARALGLL